MQRSAELQKILLPDFPDGFLPVLAKTVQGIAADAERQIKDHIQAHDMGHLGTTWLSKGYEHIKDNKCPFCDQNLTGISLIEAYKGFFSDAYNNLIDEVKMLGEEISKKFEGLELGRIDTTLQKNNSAVHFWMQYCVIQAPVLQDSEDLFVFLVRLRSSALEHLKRKAQAPMEQFDPDPTLLSDIEAFDRCKTGFAAYNQAIELVVSILDQHL